MATRKRRSSGRSTTTRTVRHKPSAAFILVLLGGILILIGGLAVAGIGAAASSLLSLGALGGLAGTIGVVSGLIVIFSAFMIHSTNPGRVHLWSLIALIFCIISIANGGGFVIGFILALVGSIIGTSYKG
ncbi:MAG TPA: hypothetical protein VL944_03435 [Candidatus Acidoferrum sp.]|nr:hypothetical protein [Candidatus Acidoferrum sp.]